jgi:Rha family phage regulatory protein
MSQELEIRFVQSSESENSPVYVSSREVAKKFGKNHKDVLRAINDLTSSTGVSTFGRRNFAPSTYVNEQGKTQPEMLLTRDGFSLVAMGFIGPEALIWKVKFLEAFDKLILSTSQLKIKIAQLEAQNQNLLNSPERIETEFGVKYVNRIPSDKKKVLRYDVDEGERRLVLASSLTFDELADILISQAEPKARGLIAASHALRAWTQAAKAAKAQREPIPTLNDFGVKTSFGENLLEALKQY